MERPFVNNIAGREAALCENSNVVWSSTLAIFGRTGNGRAMFFEGPKATHIERE